MTKKDRNRLRPIVKRLLKASRSPLGAALGGEAYPYVPQAAAQLGVASSTAEDIEALWRRPRQMMASLLAAEEAGLLRRIQRWLAWDERRRAQ